MSTFGGVFFTNKGRALQAKALTGVQLNFTRLAVGDGSLSGQVIQDLNSLIREVKSIPISILKNNSGGNVTIGGVLTNQGLSNGFYYRELGLFAQDPVLGEILYCYGNAAALAEYIPAGGGADILEKQINIIAIVGNSPNVSATINQSLVYATYEELESKVDKVPGKQLSTEDYSTIEKQKLAGLNNYAHPSSHPSTMIVMSDGTTLENFKSTVTSDLAQLTTYSVYKLNKDANDIYTEVQHKRTNGTLILKSVLSGGTSPNYTTRTITEYQADGTTIKFTKVYTLSYDANGNLTSEVLV